MKIVFVFLWRLRYNVNEVILLYVIYNNCEKSMEMNDYGIDIRVRFVEQGVNKLYKTSRKRFCYNEMRDIGWRRYEDYAKVVYREKISGMEIKSDMHVIALLQKLDGQEKKKIEILVYIVGGKEEYQSIKDKVKKIKGKN